MNRISLNKIQTTAVRLIVIASAAFVFLGQGERAGAQNQPQGTWSKYPAETIAACRKVADLSKDPYCKAILDDLTNQSGNAFTCKDIAKKVEDWTEKLKGECAGAFGDGTKFDKCWKRANACTEAEGSTQISLADTDLIKLVTDAAKKTAKEQSRSRKSDDSERTTDFDIVCKQLKEATQGCPELTTLSDGTANSYSDRNSTLEDKRNDAKDELFKAMKAQSDKMISTQEEVQKIQLALKNALKENTDRQKKLGTDLEAAIQGLGQQKTSAYAKARNDLITVEQNYIQMRDAARQADAKIARAQMALETMCRKDAEGRFREADGDRKRRLAALQAGGPRNFDVTQLAAESRRRANQNERDRNKDYAAYYLECKAGKTGTGASAKAEIEAATIDRNNTVQSLTEQATVIEQKRKELFNQLQDMEKQATEQQQMAMKKYQTDLQSLIDDANNMQSEAQQKLSSLQQKQMQQMAMSQTDLQSQQEKLNNYESKLKLNELRLSCAKRAGRSEDSAQNKITALQDALDAFDKIEQSCAALTTNSACTSATESNPWAAQVKSCGTFSDKYMKAKTKPKDSEAAQ